MKFVLTAGWDDGIADLTERLVKELASGKKVLWLTSGGSNIPASVHILSNIPAELCKKLTILLADERYGAVGHKYSNWAQLIEAGFEVNKAKCLAILQDDLSFDETEARYEQLANQAFATNDIVLAQLGVGPDGHIAGLLIDSPAIDENLQTLTTSYISQEDTPLSRLTLTFNAMKRIDAAYCFAFGAPKQATLKRLQKTRTSLDKQPAQILKQLPECYLYNDQVGHHGK